MSPNYLLSTEFDIHFEMCDHVWTLAWATYNDELDRDDPRWVCVQGCDISDCVPQSDCVAVEALSEGMSKWFMRLRELNGGAAALEAHLTALVEDRGIDYPTLAFYLTHEAIGTGVSLMDTGEHSHNLVLPPLEVHYNGEDVFLSM